MKTIKSFMMMAVAGCLFFAASSMAQITPAITVYKDPNCSCCNEWVKYLEKNGFKVVINETEIVEAVKAKEAIPVELHSCHTAKVGGYVLEGHVPVEDIKRLLSERPVAKGLAVPGMPAGSPGMEMPNYSEAYKVVLFDDKGKQTVFSDHPKK